MATRLIQRFDKNFITLSECALCTGSPKNCFPSKKKLAENLPGVSVPLSNSQEREVTIKVDANVDGKPLMKNRWKSECYDKSNSVSLLYFPS